MDNKLVKYEGGIVKRVGVVIDITNKLIRSSQNQSLQLFNPELYQYSISSKEELLNFIKVNFWYFLNAIIQKERMKDYTDDEISKETLQTIRRTKYLYEYPRCSYKSRIDGDKFDKLKDINSCEISIKLDNDFKQEILNLVCPTIAGKLLSDFVDTSIGQLLFSVQDVSLQDMMPVSLYYETGNDFAVQILKANTPIPVETKQTFSTSVNWQKDIDINLLQGFSDKASENISLMKFSIENIPIALKGVFQVQVTFRIDVNGILNLSTENKTARIVIKETFGGLNQDELNKLKDVTT